MKGKPTNTVSKGTQVAMDQCKPGKCDMETMQGPMPEDTGKSHKGM